MEGQVEQNGGLPGLSPSTDIHVEQSELQALIRKWVDLIRTNNPMITEPELITTQAQRTAVIHLVIPGRDMPKHMDPAIQEVLKTLKDQGLQPAGPMFSYHHRRPSDTFDFELGFPVTKAITPSERVVNGTLPAETVVRCVHQGPYEGLSQAWPALMERVREKNYAETGRFWERYLTNPEEVKDPKNYRTELNWVVERS